MAQSDVDRIWQNFSRGIPNEHVTPPVRDILNDFVNECATQCVNAGEQRLSVEADRLEEERRCIEVEEQLDRDGSPWSASREYGEDD